MWSRVRTDRCAGTKPRADFGGSPSEEPTEDAPEDTSRRRRCRRTPRKSQDEEPPSESEEDEACVGVALAWLFWRASLLLLASPPPGGGPELAVGDHVQAGVRRGGDGCPRSFRRRTAEHRTGGAGARCTRCTFGTTKRAFEPVAEYEDGRLDLGVEGTKRKLRWKEKEPRRWSSPWRGESP